MYYKLDSNGYKMMFPKISITIPSYNQAEYLEETLCSVLDQHYPNLELIVIDGGSTDGSVEILKRYSEQLAYWVSEPDRGQTHAINKGLNKSTGEIWSYLNSDDLLCPGSLETVAKTFQTPEISWLGGVSDVFDEQGSGGHIIPQKPRHDRDYLAPWSREHQYVFPCSNVCFMRRQLLERCGEFDESYHYGMDIEYYLRAIFQARADLYLIPDALGRWRWHSESKTLKQGIAYGFREDEVRMAKQYLNYLAPADQAALQVELKEQEQWLVTRRAMFHHEQGNPQQAWKELLFQVKHDPKLLQFRPWYGMIKALMLDAIAN